MNLFFVIFSFPVSYILPSFDSVFFFFPSFHSILSFFMLAIFFLSFPHSYDCTAQTKLGFQSHSLDSQIESFHPKNPYIDPNVRVIHILPTTFIRLNGCYFMLCFPHFYLYFPPFGHVPTFFLCFHHPLSTLK